MVRKELHKEERHQRSNKIQSNCYSSSYKHDMHYIPICLIVLLLPLSLSLSQVSELIGELASRLRSFNIVTVNYFSK